MIRIVEYRTKDGKNNFGDWFVRIPAKHAIRVTEALYRMQRGNFGDHKSVGDGVMERIGVIVANPEFKQIPQHIEGIGIGCVALQKAHQGGRHVGPVAAQVNVTDKEGAHDGVQGALITGWLEKVAG